MSKAKYQGYEQLETILGEALEQAAAGKGKERHATGQAFEDQPMQLISKLLDDNHGLAFQAIKKIQESLRLSPDRAERELLGAINYIAGMIIFLRARAKTPVKPKTDPFDMDKLQRAIFTQETPGPHCGTKHHPWILCDGVMPTPYWYTLAGTSITYTDSRLDWIRKNPKLRFDPDNHGTITGPVSPKNPPSGDTVPLKQYNELLAQYTQLERRLQELN